MNPYAAPVASVIILVLLFTAILKGAGGAADADGKPKAVVFVIEGLSATVFEDACVHGVRAPNLRSLIAYGAHAACVSASDTRCARTQSGTALSSRNSFDAAPGIASILTGVNADKHEVYNTSFDAMLRFTATSERFPTFLKVANRGGLRTAAVGGASFLTAIEDGTGKCSAYGVADFECGASVLGRCMLPTSCNLDDRMPLITRRSTTGGLDRTAQTSTVEDVERFLESGADVIVVHINRPNIAATTAARGAFAADSAPYTAQLYLADAIVGAVTAMVSARARDLHENWLVLGSSDHGGSGSTYGSNPATDGVVPLFASVITSGGNVALEAPTGRATQMDVAPTLLKWFGLLTAELEANMDGRSQFICGGGRAAGNCSKAANNGVTAINEE